MREKEAKRQEELKIIEQKRQADEAMKVKAGQGAIDWAKIVEYKKKKKAELDNKPVNKLDKRYNCVKHVQDQFINPKQSPYKNVDITIYR